VIAYSAGPRQVAPNDSAYARALVTRMQQEGVELRQMFDRVRADANLTPEVTMTTRPTDIITAMLEPLMFFEGRCEDKATLRRLIDIAR
jgi:hypothetical protein